MYSYFVKTLWDIWKWLSQFFPESTDHDNNGDKENPENIDESQMLDEGDDGEYLPEQMQDGMYVTRIKK